MSKLTIWLPDGEMWANQVQYFLNKSPALYDYTRAYGHPGGTFIVLGCLFHMLFGLSFSTSLTLSVSLLIALATAACAALCFLLQPQTLWWFTTGFILTISRLYNTATPPTAAAMPLLSLIVLASCWILTQKKTEIRRLCFLWGALLGVSCSTRLDISLFVGIPLLFLLWRWSGTHGIAPVMVGVVASFFLSDPFMWFMPAQHVLDLVHKFTLHYSNFPQRMTLRWYEWTNGVSLAVIAMVWFLVLLYRRRLGVGIPTQVMLVFLGISVFAGLLLTSSKYQAIRYLYPLIIVWEVLLPLYALQKSPSPDAQGAAATGILDQRTRWVVLGFVIPTQLLGHIVTFFT